VRNVCRKLVVVVSLFLTAGCNYCGKRVQDLEDAIYFHVGVGLGLEAHASVFPMFGQVGLGGHVSRRTGWDGWQHGSWKEAQFVFAFPLCLGMFAVDRLEYPLHMCRMPIYSGCIPMTIQANRFVIGPEAGFFAGIVGAEGGVDVLQLCDFLAGFAGCDLLSDDDVDVPGVLSGDWSVVGAYALRPFWSALREMSDAQVVSFLPHTAGEARILVYEELLRRPIPNKVELMLEHFEFRTFNTNEPRVALETIRQAAAQRPPDDPIHAEIDELERRTFPPINARADGELPR
jgi:hypothetical protein